MLSRPVALAALAILLAAIPAARISHADSWSPSVRIAGGTPMGEGPAPWLGLAGHVVRDNAWIRLGIEGSWWEQLGYNGTTHAADTGVYPYRTRYTDFLMGAIVQLSPAQERAPVYLVLGVADLVVVEKSYYAEFPTQSVWGHAPTLSGGVGYAVADGFGQSVEARWYWRREESDPWAPNRYFILSAGVRF